MQDSGFLAQFLYLLVYSSSLICASAVLLFRKRLGRETGRPAGRLIILISVCSSLISLQVFLSAVGLLQQLNRAGASRLTLSMNVLIIITISAAVHSAVSVSYANRPGSFSKRARLIAAVLVAGMLAAIIVLQALTLFGYSLPAAELLGILMTAGIALFSAVIIFAAIRLFIPLRLSTDRSGHSALRLLLMLLFIFPALFLISGSRIGTYTAPAGFILLNILGIRIIFIIVKGSVDAVNSDKEHRAPPDPADTCRELGLSKRESEVAILLARGCAYKEIAAKLFISMSTTQTHVGRIYSKLGINNKTELSNMIFFNKN